MQPHAGRFDYFCSASTRRFRATSLLPTPLRPFYPRLAPRLRSEWQTLLISLFPLEGPSRLFLSPPRFISAQSIFARFRNRYSLFFSRCIGWSVKKRRKENGRKKDTYIGNIYLFSCNCKLWKKWPTWNLDCRSD